MEISSPYLTVNVQKKFHLIHISLHFLATLGTHWDGQPAARGVGGLCTFSTYAIGNYKTVIFAIKPFSQGTHIYVYVERSYISHGFYSCNDKYLTELNCSVLFAACNKTVRLCVLYIILLVFRRAVGTLTLKGIEVIICAVVLQLWWVLEFNCCILNNCIPLFTMAT